MQTLSFFRRPIKALLPASLLLVAACSKKDDPIVVAPDQGRIAVYHAAASANVGVKVLFDDAEKASLTYGQKSDYLSLNTGSRVIKVNVASSGSNVLTKAVTVEKDKSYSYFAYASSVIAVGDLLTTDDLTAPSTGKAKIRFVHLGQGAASSLTLSSTVASIAEIAGTRTAFGAASDFVEILAGSYNVAVTGTAGVVTNVGDGNGSGTVANKTYEAGKIYTVVFRGITGPLVDPALQPKAFLIQNN